MEKTLAGSCRTPSPVFIGETGKMVDCFAVSASDEGIAADQPASACVYKRGAGIGWFKNQQCRNGGNDKAVELQSHEAVRW